MSGEAYSVAIPQAVGGRAPITYALDGALPNGATGFDEDTRILSGTAPAGTVAQTADFEATDSTQVVIRPDGGLTEIGIGYDLASAAWQSVGMVSVANIVYVGLLETTGVDSFNLFTLNLITGALTAIGTGHDLGGGTFDGGGMFLVGNTVYVGIVKPGEASFHLFYIEPRNRRVDRDRQRA